MTSIKDQPRALLSAASSVATSCVAAFCSISLSRRAILLCIRSAFALDASFSAFFARVSAASLSEPAACNQIPVQGETFAAGQLGTGKTASHTGCTR